MTYMPKELQKVVGTRPIRPDGVDKVTGKANFGADMVMPGMLWGKVKRSPHAHARIMSIDTEEAMKPDAPILHDDLFTQGVEPKPTHPSNVAKMIGFTKGDLDAGFREADVIIERRYSNAPVHQAYIEPHACVVSVAADGQCTIWSSSQGQFMVRAYCAKLLGMDISQIRAIPAEIGGGFGGKTLI